MKKIRLLLVVLMFLICSAGCGSKGVPQEEYDALKAQAESLQSELESAKDALARAQEQLALKEEAEVRKAAEEAAEKAAEEPKESGTPETAGSEQSAENTLTAGEEFDVSETEIRGGTNQADATQIPLNTKVYGTLHDGQNMYGTLHDGQNMYGTFHTGPGTGSTYQITVINKNPADAKIGFCILDDLGTELAGEAAYGSGIAATLTAEKLSPDTDYYLRLNVQNSTNSSSRNDTSRFAVTIRDIDQQSEGVNTTNDLVNAVVPSNDIEDLVVGTNQDDSALIPFDKTVSGDLKDALGGWFAFATGENPDSSCSVSVVNKSTDDHLRVGFYVFDELGTEVAEGSAYSDGVTKTLTLDGLDPDTVYYIRLIVQNRNNSGTRNDTVGYSLTVRCQNSAVEANTAEVAEAEEAVFETPFELSSTQVRFVANKAVFINENEAKEALAPVADIILAHPDHPILLAGTTAQWGSQESCVTLSNRRADAVKDLLVSYFGVPESQLLTAGLGYEADPFVRGRDVDAKGDFVETEGAKNRRVVVLDAESDIARRILGN